MEVSKILQTVLDIYHDPDYDRIPLETYLSYITDALNLVLLVRPDANAQYEDITLVTGNEQAIPYDGYRLIDVLYNLDESDNPTQPITKVDRMVLDNSYPTWMADTGDVVYNYIFNIKVPKKFHVYPKVTAGQKVRIVYSKSFPLITSATSTIDIDEIFFTPIIDAVLYFLYRMDTESSEHALAKAQFHAQTFNSALGIELQKGLDIIPKEGE